jgi:AmmeMemoRadiSam system protein A
MDPFVELARLSIQHYVRFQRALDGVPTELAAALSGPPAGLFVSIHTLDGELRGCKGTLQPSHDSLIEEIVRIAISACARDPRFPPVRAEELERLDIKVDVLSELEPVDSQSRLDPRRYGVLVMTADGRRGVLLPDLEDVDTVEQQLAIACRKAGIHPERDEFTLQRFTVTRHASP